MPVDANVIDSIHLLLRSGKYVIPADSGIGDVGRPVVTGQKGGRTATFETFFDYFISSVPNPDEAKQFNPNVEQQLRMHPDVSAYHTKRAFTVSAMPWRIEANPQARNKPEAEIIAQHCRDVVGKIPNFEQCIEMLEQAVLIGGQGIEFTWHQEANGVEYPTAWHPVHMSRFMFDRLGNLALLTRDQAVWGAYVATDPSAQYKSKGILPQGKFVYHVYRMGQGTWYNPPLEGYVYYGMGEDVAIYYVLTFDIFCLKMRMKFLEKYGMPPVRLYYPENRAFSAETRRIADSIRGESLASIPRLMGGTTPSDYNNLYKVEDVAMPSGNFDHFDSHTNGYTKPRIKAILLGDDTGDQEGVKGGYSSDVSKRDSGPNVYFRRDAKIIGGTLTNQFMPAVARGRYPNLPPDMIPIFSLEPKEEKDRMQEGQVIEQARKIGLKITKQHAYDAMDLPMPKPGDELLEDPQPQGQPGMPAQGAPGTPPATSPKPTNGGAVRFGMPPTQGQRQPVGHAGGNGAIADN